MEEGLPAVLSIGSIRLAVQVRGDAWPEPGQTLLARDFTLVGSGKAANVAHMARRMGQRAMLVGCVGADALAEHALRGLREDRVDLQFVSATTQKPTGVSLVLVQPDGQKVVFVANNANDCRAEHTVLDVERAIDNAPPESVIVIDLEIPSGVVRAAINRARARRLPVILDPSPVERLQRDILGAVECITATSSEAARLTGIRVDGVLSARRAAARLHETGVAAAYVKLPGGGCVLACQQGVFHILVPPHPPGDTASVADAFAGAMAVAFLEKRRYVEAGRFATAAAVCTVGSSATLATQPDRATIEQQIDRMELHAFT